MKQFLLCVCLLVAIPCYSQESSDEYNRLVDQVLELTGALNIGQELGELIAVQMTEGLQAADPELPDEVYEVIAEEVYATISESMASGSFQELMYPIYAEHLSQVDLEAMIAFYQTDSGKRIANALPIMSTQGMLAGQQWGESIAPRISSRVIQRLEDEGYELPH